MVFWNQVFCENGKEKETCKVCERPFYKSGEEEPDHEHALRCWHYPEYCIRCCP